MGDNGRAGPRAGLVRAAVVVGLLGALCACAAAPAPSRTATSAPSSTRSSTADPASSTTPGTDWASVVSQENARPGDAAGLIPAARGNAAGLAAYADRVSVTPGQGVGLYVATASPEHVAVTALRVGWYGGAGFRSVWTGSMQAGPQPAAATVTAPLADAGGVANTQARYAPWALGLVVPTTGWPEGMYLLRLDAGPASRYVPLTVRSTTAAGRLLVLDAPMTWEAYNAWGGRSLYGDEQKRLANRSTAVSFDRPYDDGYGSGRFFEHVAPILREAEQLGLPLAWATDYDVALDPGLLEGAVGIVVGGHSEYWTAGERDAVVSQVAQGTNLAVFGANTAYWRVRLAGRDVALAAQPDRRDRRPRIVFGAKGALDPLAASDPAGATVRFRDKPSAQPEELLTGQRYDCHPASADWVVADPTWWGYAGTGLTQGARLPRVIGPESDRAYPVATTPRPLQVVAYSPLSCAGHPTEQTAAYWTNTAGAGVFAAGTMGWPKAMTVPSTAAALQRITGNVLTAFARPDAGTSHPATDTLGTFALPATNTSHGD